MHGYQQDEQGNFQPIEDEPEAPEHRAQGGVGDFFANLFTGGLYGVGQAAATEVAQGQAAVANAQSVTDRATQTAYLNSRWGRLNADSNYYGQPGGNQTLGVIPAGTRVQIASPNFHQAGGHNWIGVSLPPGQGVLRGKIGWVWAEIVTPEGGAPVRGRGDGRRGDARGRGGRDLGRGGRDVGRDIGTAVGGSGTITVTQRTNVYDSPSTGARIVGAIGGSGPVHVPVLQRQAGWVQTQPPGWGRSGWIQFGAGAGTSRMPAYGVPAPMTGVSTLSGIAAPGYAYTPSGLAPAPGYAVAYPSYQPMYQPLPVTIPQTPVGGIDPAILQLLLQQAQAQGAEQAALQAILDQLHAGANFAPAVQGMGLDLNTLLQGAGVKLDAAGLPVPAGYMGTDQGGADIYADGGVDPTGGALGDYTDPRSQY